MKPSKRSIPIDVMPLSPYIPYREKEPRPSTRMSHLDCLNPVAMRQGLIPNTVCTLDHIAHDTEIGLVNVFSPYADLHVMMVNLGAKHCPGPLCLDEQVGDQIMAVAAHTLGFFKECEADDIFLGWNFSPWSWGDAEMKSGGQSFPTRFHPHLGGRTQSETQTKEWDELTPHERRLMGENDYAYLMGKSILSSMDHSGNLLNHVAMDDAYADDMGLILPLRHDLVVAISSEGFFNDVVVTVADAAEETIKNLCSAMTSLSGSFLCQHLRRVEQGVWQSNDLELLMADPVMRDTAESLDLFKEYCIDPELLEVLAPHVQARCERDESRKEEWWRKGFAYSAVFYCDPELGPVLRVAPYVTIGPCGLHEAQGRLLSRPLNHKTTNDATMKRSRLLWDLADQLRIAELAS